jgi:hypothetical protein
MSKVSKKQLIYYEDKTTTTKHSFCDKKMLKDKNIRGRTASLK